MLNNEQYNPSEMSTYTQMERYKNELKACDFAPVEKADFDSDAIGELIDFIVISDAAFIRGNEIVIFEVNEQDAAFMRITHYTHARKVRESEYKNGILLNKLN